MQSVSYYIYAIVMTSSTYTICVYKNYDKALKNFSLFIIV